MSSGLAGVRFAPSPTGRFHLGNLRTAWISWRIAQALGEPWVIRFEDIDAPRVKPGAREAQLADLDVLGLVPDQIETQSDQHAFHLELLLKAVESERVYPCVCSRADVLRELAGLASAANALPLAGAIPRKPCYSGKCRNSKVPQVLPPGKREIGWRFRSEAGAEGSFDALVGKSRSLNPTENFVPAYPWACALDDALGKYRVLVRAWDLAEADGIQSELRAWVAPGQSACQVFHTALLVQEDGSRLEKRTAGVTLGELFSGVRPETPATLLQYFERSFDLSGALQQLGSSTSGGVLGEETRILPWSQLFR